MAKAQVGFYTKSQIAAQVAEEDALQANLLAHPVSTVSSSMTIFETTQRVILLKILRELRLLNTDPNS